MLDHGNPAAILHKGTEELYLLYRGQISMDNIIGIRMCRFGLIRDITFEAILTTI